MRITHRKEKKPQPYVLRDTHYKYSQTQRTVNFIPILYISHSFGGETLELLPRELGYPSLEMPKATEGPGLMVGRGVGSR